MPSHPSLRRFGALPVSRAVEVGFALLVIYHFSGGQFLSAPNAAEPGLDPQEGSRLLYLLNTAIYLLSLVLAVRRPRAFWRACSSDGVLVLLLALTLASALWSAAPDVAFRRALALLGTALFGIYLHVRYPLEQQLKLLGGGLAIGIVLSLIVIGVSELSRDSYVRGVYENKNSLGRMTALAALVYLFLAWTGRRRAIPLIFLGLSILLVLLARSATALVVVVTMVSLIPLLKTLKRDARPTVVLGCIAVLVFGATLLFLAPTPEVLAGVLGRDVTLTGRAPLWAAVVGMIGEQPWLGYGYETFWLTGLPFRLAVDENAGWIAPNAHNGFLEVALSLGLIGLFLFLLVLGRGVNRSVRLLRVERGPLALWPLVYLGFLGLYNLTESTSLPRLSLCWVLFVTTLLAVSPKARRETAASGVTRGRARPHFLPWLSYGSAGQPSLSHPDHPPASRAPHVGS